MNSSETWKGITKSLMHITKISKFASIADIFLCKVFQKRNPNQERQEGWNNPGSGWKWQYGKSF